jgi:Ala-tRNA(Pro) deacylase
LGERLDGIQKAAGSSPAGSTRTSVATDDLTRALDEAGVDYELLPHTHTESALAEAQALGVPPIEVAKTIVVTSAEGYVRAVVPASKRIDLRKLRKVTGGGKKEVQLATEADLARDFPEFELGAVPPVGGARRDPVVLDARLVDLDLIVLEAGTHDSSVRLSTSDLQRVANAEVGDICAD